MPPAGNDVTPTMWTCPLCERTFANRYQTRTCAPLGDLDQHFTRNSTHVRETFDRALAVLENAGLPFSILPEKSRIALHVRMSFAAFVPRRTWLNGHVVLARTIQSERWTKVEIYSPRNVLHGFRLAVPDEVDSQFAAWLREAYEVGAQRHKP